MFLSPTRTKTIVVPITVSTSAYSSEDAIDTLKSLVNVVARRGDVAWLTEVVMTDAANQKSALSLFFFNAPIASTITDNAAFDPTDAELLANFVGFVPVAAANYVSLSDNAVGTQVPAFPIGLKTKNSTNLYVAIASAGTPTYAAATDLSLKLTFASRN